MNVDTFFQRFRLVTRAPNGVSKLRELILQLAVTGRLFPDPEPESVDSLLSEMDMERGRLIETGELSPGRPICDVDSGSQHTRVPKHWRWMRLGNLTSKIGSGSTPRGGSKVYVSTGVAFLRSQNVWNDGIQLDDVVYIAESTHARMKNTRVIATDILLNITGASLGRCAKVPDDFPEANVSQHVTIIRPLLPALRHFLHICLLSPMGQSMIWGRQVGMAREGLSKKVLEQFEIPLPPLQEQQRIVTKVDELMQLCDRLTRELAAKEIDGTWWNLPASKAVRKEEGDNHWLWRKIVGSNHAKLTWEALAIQTSGGSIEGAITYRIDAQSRLQSGEGAVYVDRIATAPRNRPWVVEPPKYQGIGSVLLLAAVRHSYLLGLGGRVWLSSLPSERTRKFYRDRGFEVIFQDSDGMIGFELPAAAAEKWLEKRGYL